MLRWIFIGGLLASCAGDETLSRYATVDHDYRLITMNGAPTPADVTLRIAKGGALNGSAPCNRYSTQSTVPYPWLEIAPILTTKRACPALDFEGQYLRALQSMTLAEASGPILILSNDAGNTLTFELQPAR